MLPTLCLIIKYEGNRKGTAALNMSKHELRARRATIFAPLFCNGRRDQIGKMFLHTNMGF